MSLRENASPIRRRVYLDHAATSWPKPPKVNAAWLEYQEQVGVTAGRGSYRSSIDAQAIVDDVRRRLAKLIGATSPTSIAMVHNGTAALNLAFSGLLQRGDHVVTTSAEHNSVLRPLHLMIKNLGIRLSIVDCDETGWVPPDAIESKMEQKTRMVAVTHASNVTGRIQSIAEIGSISKSHGAWLLVDAAQTLGYIPIDVDSMQIDLLAAPGHKGAGGVMGCGMLYAGDDISRLICSPWVGGSGTRSESLEGPTEWPAKAEAGNLNVPAIAAWQTGLKWIEASRSGAAHGADESVFLHRDMSGLYQRMVGLLKRLKCCSVIGHASDPMNAYVPVVSMRSVDAKLTAADLAGILDSSFDIEVRSGLHCAALIHQSLGTIESGGTVRFSMGHTSTHADLDRLELAVDQLNAVML